MSRSYRAEHNELDVLSSRLNDHHRLLDRIYTLPTQVKYNIMVPLGKAGFIPGEIVHTNEFKHLEANVPPTMENLEKAELISYTDASAIIEKKIDTISKRITELNKILGIKIERDDDEDEDYYVEKKKVGVKKVEETKPVTKDNVELKSALKKTTPPSSSSTSTTTPSTASSSSSSSSSSTSSSSSSSTSSSSSSSLSSIEPYTSSSSSTTTPTPLVSNDPVFEIREIVDDSGNVQGKEVVDISKQLKMMEDMSKDMESVSTFNEEDAFIREIADIQNKVNVNPFSNDINNEKEDLMSFFDRLELASNKNSNNNNNNTTTTSKSSGWKSGFLGGNKQAKDNKQVKEVEKKSVKFSDNLESSTTFSSTSPTNSITPASLPIPPSNPPSVTTSTTSSTTTSTTTNPPSVPSTEPSSIPSSTSNRPVSISVKEKKGNAPAPKPFVLRGPTSTSHRPKNNNNE